MKVYYRTQVAILWYEKIPKGKTPDPIAEVRVTAVSDEKGRYDTEKFVSACIHAMFVLSPQTYWLERSKKVLAYEKDEPIMEDEIPLSVPYSKRINYAERYVVFFRSRRDRSKWLREELGLDYWLLPYDELREVVKPRTGDYEYDEGYIKEAEKRMIEAGRVRTRFDNELGRLVLV